MTETFVSDVPAEAVGVVSGYVMFPLGKSTISQAEQKFAGNDSGGESHGESFGR